MRTFTKVLLLAVAPAAAAVAIRVAMMEARVHADARISHPPNSRVLSYENAWQYGAGTTSTSYVFTEDVVVGVMVTCKEYSYLKEPGTGRYNLIGQDCSESHQKVRP